MAALLYKTHQRLTYSICDLVQLQEIPAPVTLQSSTWPFDAFALMHLIWHYVKEFMQLNVISYFWQKLNKSRAIYYLWIIDANDACTNGAFLYHLHSTFIHDAWSLILKHVLMMMHECVIYLWFLTLGLRKAKVLKPRPNPRPKIMSEFLLQV